MHQQSNDWGNQVHEPAGLKAFMNNESSEAESGDESSDTSSDNEEIGCGIDL